MMILASGYLRRLQLESRAQAAAIVNALGEAMDGRGANRVPAEAMLAMMGGL
jgi:hypothetical protein